jgi:hypothetical protein
MIQLHERPLLYPRDITPRDAQLLSNLPLRPLFPACIQSKSPNDNFFFPIIQNIKITKNLALLNLQIDLFNDIISLGAKDIDECNFVPLFVRTNRIVQRYVLRVFFKDLRCIRISFSIQRAAKVASFVPLFGR